jgi:hypothetical protein
MSDSLGDGAGNPTDDQIRLYERWAQGGLALSIIGEVQGTPHFAEKPGNLILNDQSDNGLLERLAKAGATANAQLWLLLGHAGAMADAPISTPKGPSALDLADPNTSIMLQQRINVCFGEAAPQRAGPTRTVILGRSRDFATVAMRGDLNWLMQHTVRTSLLASDIARSCGGVR